MACLYRLKNSGGGRAMFDFTIIIKLAALGICVTILNEVLDSVNAKNWKYPVSVVGIIMGLLLIMDYVTQLFEIVQTFAR